MIACSLWHEERVIPTRARIQVVLDPFAGSHTILYCRQCRKARCASSCPEDAIHWVDELGYWALDKALCTGCGLCVDACPYDAMVLASTALKCDTCLGDPVCAGVCIKGALAWQRDDDGGPHDKH